MSEKPKPFDPLSEARKIVDNKEKELSNSAVVEATDIVAKKQEKSEKNKKALSEARDIIANKINNESVENNSKKIEPSQKGKIIDLSGLRSGYTPVDKKRENGIDNIGKYDSYDNKEVSKN